MVERITTTCPECGAEDSLVQKVILTIEQRRPQQLYRLPSGALHLYESGADELGDTLDSEECDDGLVCDDCGEPFDWDDLETLIESEDEE